jgi:hypothetical protein
MKVVEKLFINYLSMPIYPASDNYIAARRLLQLTEPPRSELIKKAISLRDIIHPACPISVFKAEAFLNSGVSKIDIIKDEQRISLNKNDGWDFRIKEFLGLFVESINEIVIDSVDKYNTDRALVPTITNEEDKEYFN